MGRYGTYDDFDDELDMRRLRVDRDRPHGGASVAAAVMGVLGLVGAVCTTIVIAALDAADPGPDDDMWMGMLALAMLGFGTLATAGFVLGLVGAFQRDRNPLYGIIGVVMNALTIAGMTVLICMGVLSDF